MFRNFALKNINLVSIIVFLFFFILIIVSKPNIIFDNHGKPREFGLGYKNKTIVPIWLIVIILAILSYLLILYYINFKRIMF